MKDLAKSAVVAAALLGLALSGTAQADADYPYAATGHLSGGGKWLDTSASGVFFLPDNGERDVALIVGGGDFVIPLDGNWNIQLGGALQAEHEHQFDIGADTITQFQGSAIAFWRDPGTGVFGIEGGAFSRPEGERKYVKLGGVAEYFFGETATVGAFGGVLIPFADRSVEQKTGYYAGGQATWYAGHDLAFAGFARYTQTGLASSFDAGSFDSVTLDHLMVGGTVRHLTPMPGVEVYASAAYVWCRGDADVSFDDEFETNGAVTDKGVQVLVGIRIRLGGHTDSLVGVDRSNAIDTDTWTCPSGVFEVEEPIVEDDDFTDIASAAN